MMSDTLHNKYLSIGGFIMVIYVIKILFVMLIALYFIQKKLSALQEGLYNIYISNRKNVNLYDDEIIYQRPDIYKIYGYFKCYNNYKLKNGLKVKIEMINGDEFIGYIVGFTRKSNMAIYTETRDLIYTHIKYVKMLYIFDESYQDGCDYNIRDIYTLDRTAIARSIKEKRLKNDRDLYILKLGR